MTESVAPPRQGGSYLRLPDGSLQPNPEPAEAVAEQPAPPAAPAEAVNASVNKKGAK